MTNENNQSQELAAIINEVAAEVQAEKQPITIESLGTWEKLAEDNDYTTYRDKVTGKIFRKQRYHEIRTINPRTKAEKLKLMTVLSDATPFDQAVGHTLLLGGFIIEPYTTIDEATNNILAGVTTTLISSDFNMAYATNSKTVYNTLKDAYRSLGEEIIDLDDPIAVEIIEKKIDGSKRPVKDIKFKL